jgi:Transposase DDE domain
MTFLDGTIIRAPQSRRGSQKWGDGKERDRRQALGRARGGFGTKADVIADSQGRAIGFARAPGQAHELLLAPKLLAHLDAVPRWVVADHGYRSHGLRQHVRNLGAKPAIPCTNEEQVRCPAWIYVNRHRVEQ